METIADGEGRVSAQVEPERGPWDVTVALPGYSAISLLGVTGPVSGRVHLTGTGDPKPAVDRYDVYGSISGRSTEPATLSFSGRGIETYVDEGADYFATILAEPGAQSLPRVLALERSTDDDARVLNAVWLDFSRSGTDLFADVDFPAPARVSLRTRMLVDPPSSGTATVELRTGRPTARRMEDEWSFPVGTTWLEANPEDQGTLFWQTEAFTGDMAPTYVRAAFYDISASLGVVLLTRPSANKALALPPVDTLDASGTTLDDLVLRWSAPAYACVGASLQRSEGGSALWFAYSFPGSQVTRRSWPRLPNGISLADVGISGSDFKVNVFANTQDDGVQSWDWPAQREQRAVLRTFAPIAAGSGSGN